MKFSEKMLLIKQGATMADIKKLEEEEALEIAATKEKSETTEDIVVDEEKEDPEKTEILTALEAANKALEESKELLKKKDDDLAALNEKFTKLTNQQTVVEPPAYTEKEVFEELFTASKKEEK